MTTHRLNPELSAALDAAVAGKPADLYRRLELASGLPGPRMNQTLAAEFARAAAGLGPKVDALIFEMANLPANEARGASGKEFVTVCGVLAVGARAADPAGQGLRNEALALLEERADDLRFRVRDAVPLALAALASQHSKYVELLVEGWMDRYFHATAVIRALADPVWLETYPVEAHEAPILLHHDAFLLAESAPRSASRYPGHKALVEAFSYTPKALAKRFGPPMFDRMTMWAENLKMPELRAAILANLDDAQLKKPFRDQILRIKELLEASKGPPRDPTRIIQGMRSRGKKRDKR